MQRGLDNTYNSRRDAEHAGRYEISVVAPMKYNVIRSASTRLVCATIRVISQRRRVRRENTGSACIAGSQNYPLRALRLGERSPGFILGAVSHQGLHARQGARLAKDFFVQKTKSSARSAPLRELLLFAQRKYDQCRHACNHKSDDVFGMQQAVHRRVCRMTRVRHYGRRNKAGQSG